MINKIKTISFEDRQKAFWFLVGVSIFSLCIYFYAIHAMATNTAVRQNLEAKIADAGGRIGALEFSYIELKNSITEEIASRYGFSEVKSPLYVTRNNPSQSLTLNH